MCNSRHEGSKPIQKRGKGWKLVQNLPLGGCHALVEGGAYRTTDGWIVWDSRSTLEEGFCFFTNKRVAQRALKVWARTVVCDCKYVKLIPIIYEEGICKHIEDRFCGGIRWPIALCKRWKPGEGV